MNTHHLAIAGKRVRMPHMKPLYAFILFFIFILMYIAKPFLLKKSGLDTQVLGASAVFYTDVLSEQTTISAKTSFAQKIIEEVETVPFETNYRDDPDMEYGEEEILEEGVDGTQTTKFLITYWFDEILSEEVSEVIVEPAKHQLTAKGTKIVWRELQTDAGTLKYWRKLHVWATKYDGNCVGCRGLTYSGTPVRKGVCAVDPRVISLGTNFYVEGYGMCRSEDIGGGVKGNMVDLGYEDVSKGEWRTGYTNVYLLTSAPE